MTETLQALMTSYGPIAVAFGCLFEGEAAILLGVFAAYQGLFSVEAVTAAAIIGTIVGDNACFHIGRHMGRPALDRRPGWQLRIARVERLLARYGAPVMIGFRFLYGLRYVTPFVLGSLGISPLRFFLYASLGTFIWAGTITWIGVHLAGAMELALAHIQIVEKIVVAVLLLGAVIGFGCYHLRRRGSPQRWLAPQTPAINDRSNRSDRHP